MQSKTKKENQQEQDPFCIMEGVAGKIALYSDILGKDYNNIKFPGYELY